MTEINELIKPVHPDYLEWIAAETDPATSSKTD